MILRASVQDFKEIRTTFECEAREKKSTKLCVWRKNPNFTDHENLKYRKCPK